MAMTISEQNYINEAINRARGAYNNAIETSRRNAERMGLNPNSGKFSAIENAAQFDIAAATAATANEASSNWLKTAQAQANEDEAMRLKYSALDLEREQLNHKIWLDKENLKKERQAAERYKKHEERNLLKNKIERYRFAPLDNTELHGGDSYSELEWLPDKDAPYGGEWNRNYNVEDKYGGELSKIRRENADRQIKKGYY